MHACTYTNEVNLDVCPGVNITADDNRIKGQEIMFARDNIDMIILAKSSDVFL